MAKYKCGAIIKEVTKGAEKWYEMAGWKKIVSNSKEKGKNNDKTNS